MSPLIQGGTVVSPTGAVPGGRAGRGRADQRAGRPRQRDRGGLGRVGGPDHGRPGPVRPARRHRRAHPHGDAVRRHLLGGHVRDRYPGRGLGRHHHDRGLRGPGQGHLAAGHAGQVARQGGRPLRDRLRLPHDRLRRQRHHAEGDGVLHRGGREQLQDVHGLPGRVLRDRRGDRPRHDQGRRDRRRDHDARGERHRDRPAGGAGAGRGEDRSGAARADPAAGTGGGSHPPGHHPGRG